MVSLPAHPTETATRPSCFGFGVESTVALRFHRCGGGVERLSIVEHRSPPPAGEGEPVFEVRTDGRRQAALWSRGGRYQFHVEDLGWYRITPGDGLIEIPADAEPVRREQVMWGVPASLCFIERGDLSIHAAAVEVDGGAVLLAAPGSYGKTTLAVAFHRAGYRILTEDSSCCCFDSFVGVRPGPALVRVRDGLGELPDGLELARRRNGRAELAITPDRRGGGASIPLRAVVFLRASDAAPALRACAPSDAIRDLWALHFGPGGTSVYARSFEQVADLAHGVPCWNLTRRLDFGLLEQTVDVIVEAVQ